MLLKLTLRCSVKLQRFKRHGCWWGCLLVGMFFLAPTCMPAATMLSINVVLRVTSPGFIDDKPE